MASLKKRHEEFIRELQAPLKHSVLLLEHNGRKFPDSVSLDEQLMEELQKRFDDLFESDDESED